MLVRYTRATKRTQSLSFLPLQAKLRTWPSLIHDSCVPQARYAHTYSDTKDALKTGIRNVKENISKGAKTDLSAWKTIKWLGTGILFISFDYSFASWYNYNNEKNLIRAFEYGSCPEPEVNKNWLIHREEIIKKLKRILEPIPDHSSYHVVVGNHGTGKTTVVRQCARDVRKGVIYVDVPPILDNFVNNLAKAIGFKEYVPITESLIRKILGSGVSNEQPRLSRVLDAFERGALKYKAKNGKPPVLILDNISKLGQKNANMLEDLQDIAKLYADQSSCIIVFVSSERTVPRMMMHLTSKESFDYLHSKLGIEEKVTNQLIQLLGGRIRDLKEYGNMINGGVTFEEVRKIVFGAINHNFHYARMMKGERNHIIGEVIVQKLVENKKNKKIHFDTFIELVNNKQIADELLQANVFSYNPKDGSVTFQSRATEVFVEENPELKSKEVFT